ncbi:MAG: DUF362 domain-containing protein [Acidobacteria bacterium]|nr:DUF362 domain-containing protein [Acidobacteriota bacterium]
MSVRISRRDLLRALPLALAWQGCRRAPYRRGDFVRPPGSAVALLAASGYDVDLADVIRRGLRELPIAVAGRRVLVKPNLVEYRDGAPVNTHPHVVAGAVDALFSAGASEIVVAEGPGHRRDVEYLLHASGLGRQLADLRVRFVDLNHDDVRVVPLRSRFMGLEALALPVEVLRADLVVSIPKLKTHHWAGMTAGLKNLFGTVPGAVYGWPKNFLHFHGIENAIVDLAATIRPGLTIVDGITAMEGDGPIMGQPRDLGVLAMGTDPVAVDATCARLIGFDPSKLPYLAIAGAFLGHADEARIAQRAERVDRFRTRFAVLPQFAPLMEARRG